MCCGRDCVEDQRWFEAAGYGEAGYGGAGGAVGRCRVGARLFGYDGAECGRVLAFADLVGGFGYYIGCYALAAQFDFYFAASPQLIAEFLPCERHGIAAVVEALGAELGGYFGAAVFGLVAERRSVGVGLFGRHGRVAVA